MARKARINASTVAKFISVDDDAIGGDPETLTTRYQEYLQSADIRKLELNPDKAPAYYYLRPFTSQERAIMQDYFASVKDGEGEASAEEFAGVRRRVLDGCLAGCVDHPMVGAELPDDGKITVTNVRWDVGTPAPRGLKASILEDEILVSGALMFLFTISRLGEEEKN